MARNLLAKKWQLGNKAKADWGYEKDVGFTLLIISDDGLELELSRSQMRRLYVGLSSLYKD